jgi:mono/diheme cytochrome c family protein
VESVSGRTSPAQGPFNAIREVASNLGKFLNVGNPAKGMSAFPNLTAGEVADLATFLNGQLQLAESAAPTLAILVGDASAGAIYFKSHCSGCHAPDKDLRGIGARYDKQTLQARIVNPRARGSVGAPTPKEGLRRVRIRRQEEPFAVGRLVLLVSRL